MADVGNKMEYQEYNLPYSEFCTTACPPRHAQYADINERIVSYVHWPVCTSQEPISLAKSGFFYTGEGTLVRCFNCNLAFQNWIPEDDPILQHVRYSSKCHYLLQLLGEGTLNSYKERIATGNKYYQVEYVAHHHRNGMPSSILQEFPEMKHPMYAVYDVRLSSFSKWPQYHPQTPKALAEAGFFYTGFQDVVRCFVCDGGLQNWEDDDDPSVEHAKWFAKCPYILKTKGEQFVQKVLKTTKEEETSYQPMTCSANGIKLQDNGQSSEVLPVTNKTRVSIAAQSVMDNGYSEAAVKMAVNKLKAHGEEIRNAQSILRVLLDMEEHGEELPTDIDLAESIESENKKLKDQLFCIECHLREKNTLFLPCAHLELCQECSSNVRQCPRCRMEVKQKIKTYMS